MSTTSCEDPRMTHCGLRFQALVGIPMKALSDEINEEVIVAFEDLRKGLCSRSASSSFGIDEWPRGSSCVYFGQSDFNGKENQSTEEQLFARSAFHKVFVGHAENLHDTSELFVLVLSGENWYPCIQFRQDTPTLIRICGRGCDIGLTQDSTYRLPLRNSSRG